MTSAGLGAAPPILPCRVQRICRLLDSCDCSHVVAVGADHAVHLTGYSRYLGGPAAVVMTADGQRTLIVPRHELAAAEDLAAAECVLSYGSDDFLDFDPLPSLAASCRSVIGTGRCALAAGPGTRDVFVGKCAPHRLDFDVELHNVRRIKDTDEVERIRRSFELALVGQRAVEAMLDTEPTEIQLFTAAHAAAQNAAGEPVEFIATIASGAHSALICPPWHVPATDRVDPQAALLCDIAIRHRGYWGDSTRTYGAEGDLAAARESLTRILDTVATRFRAGTPVASAHGEIADSVREALPGASFPHHGGHGIGIEVGENPQVVPGDETLLEPGMVFALEPGAYFAGRFGVRVENTYVVGPNRAHLITAVRSDDPLLADTDGASARADEGSSVISPSYRDRHDRH